MNNLCPRCNKGMLFLVVKQKIVLSIESIAMTDVIPGQKVDHREVSYLECLECGWNGWVDEYHEIKNGIVPLFVSERKHEDID